MAPHRGRLFADTKTSAAQPADSASPRRPGVSQVAAPRPRRNLEPSGSAFRPPASLMALTKTPTGRGTALARRQVVYCWSSVA